MASPRDFYVYVANPHVTVVIGRPESNEKAMRSVRISRVEGDSRRDAATAEGGVSDEWHLDLFNAFGHLAFESARGLVIQS